MMKKRCLTPYFFCSFFYGFLSSVIKDVVRKFFITCVLKEKKEIFFQNLISCLS